VSAAHAPHLGGLSAACATLCLASGLGLEVDLAEAPTATPTPSDHALLFAESAARLLVAVPRARAGELDALCARHDAVACAAIGAFREGDALRIARGDRALIDVSLAALRAAFRRDPRAEKGSAS
jgi:phosphoribosylformylglycinamidine (FGAM) synthase-like enzyme